MDFSFTLTNYKPHPANKNYTVYHFREKERAQYFENLLIEEKIPFESDSETTEDGTVFLYAVHNRFHKRALNCNHLTIGRFRSPFIPDKFFKYFVIFISVLVVALAVIGYFLAG